MASRATPSRAVRGSGSAMLWTITLILGACSSGASSPPDSDAPLGEEPASAVTATTLVGSWTRTQDCEGQLAAFQDAGLAESHLEWVTGNWFPEGSEPDAERPCDGSRPAEEHSHFFTDAGGFGSTDAEGAQVDDGDYVLIDEDTVSFPSHATEFGYDGQVLVDVVIDGDSATFEVQIPEDCADSCADAYAWALSAFYPSATWHRD